jgi:hypothetical protein
MTILPLEQNGEQVLLADPSFHLCSIFSTYGYDTQEFRHALTRREAALGPATVANESLLLLCTLLQPHLPDLSACLLWHESTLTAAEKQQVLPPDVAVQKTLTMQLRDRQVLVTGIGDFHMQRSHIRVIAQRLALPPHAWKHCTINPKHIDPQQTYGMVEGMVSPFIPWSRSTTLAAIVHIRQETEQRWNSLSISLSRFESLVIPRTLFPTLLERYARITYPHLCLIDLY